MTSFKQMTFDDWEAIYEPMPVPGTNTFHFETYDLELKCVRFMLALFPEHIWTWCSEGNSEWISNGYHYVNRMGYYITKIPRIPNVEYEIDFEFEYEDEEE